MNRLLYAIVLLFGIAASVMSMASAAQQQPVKIVALYNLTGGMASLDQPSLRGAQLRAKQINASGGVLDGRKITIVSIDTRTKLKEAAIAARRAVNMDNIVAGIGYSDTSFVLAAGPVFQRAGIPFVTSGATLPTLPKVVGDHLFLTAFGDNVQAEAMAEYAYDELGIHNIAVWTDQGMDYTKALSKYFRQRYKELGGNIVLKGKYMSGDKDFSAQVTRLESYVDKIGGVFVAAGPNEAGLIVKQIRQAGIELPILGGDGFDTPLVVSVPGKELANNVYFSTHAVIGEKAERFRKAYKAEYGHPPENTFATLAYDAVGLVADAIERAGSTDHDAVTKALAATRNYDAVTGTISYAKGNVPSKPVAVMKVEHGDVNRVTVVQPPASGEG